MSEGTEVQVPPHSDEMEIQMARELSAMLQKQTALSAQRMSDVLKTQKLLQQQIESTAVTADESLKLLTETLVRVRLYNEEGAQLLRELFDAHQALKLSMSNQTR